jgi:hypothetical protein
MALTFKGQIFPLGDSMDDTNSAIVQAKTQIYELIFSPGYYLYRGEEFRIDGGTLPPFPYLVVLLKADTSEFLKVLGIGFQDSSLNANDISMVCSLCFSLNRWMITQTIKKSVVNLYLMRCLV